jgi:Flp pilus assembly protein TadG
MRRYVIWYVLACLWAAIAIAGLARHRTGNAALEGAFAVLFAIIGVFVKRRDALAAARHTARRPK